MLLRKGKRLFFVFVLTAIIISGQVLPNTLFSVSVQHPHALTEVNNTDEDEDTTHNTTTITAAYEAVIPILKLQITTCFHLVQELILLSEIEQQPEFSIPPYINDFFRTLFRHIVAPNAP